MSAARARDRHVARVTAALVTCLTLAAGCRGPKPVPADVSASPARPQRVWPAALAAGRSALALREFARADSVFAAFQTAYPERDAAAEAGYWRAMIGLDPENAAGDTAAAGAALEAYRATDPPRPHYFEAGVLRALVARVDSLRLTLAYERSAAAAAAAAAAAQRATMVPRDSLRVREDEVTAARAEAAAARAELDRVRRRIAAPGAVFAPPPLPPPAPVPVAPAPASPAAPPPRGTP